MNYKRGEALAQLAVWKLASDRSDDYEHCRMPAMNGVEIPSCSTDCACRRNETQAHLREMGRGAVGEFGADGEDY